MLSLIKKNKLIRKTLQKTLPLIFRRKIAEILRPPYSDKELEYKIIFIHVPKTAGTAIIKALFGEEVHHLGHDKIKKYKKFDKKKYENFFKIAYVRNPWDRLVSAYFFLKQDPWGKYDDEFVNQYLKKYNSFEKFILDLKSNKAKRKKILSWPVFIPQYKFICINNEIKVDFLGKFENINSDFNKLKNILGKDNIYLEKRNKSEHKSYTEYYNEKTKKIVGEIYKKDIEMFNYEFGE